MECPTKGNYHVSFAPPLRFSLPHHEPSRCCHEPLLPTTHRPGNGRAFQRELVGPPGSLSKPSAVAPPRPPPPPHPPPPPPPPPPSPPASSTPPPTPSQTTAQRNETGPTSPPPPKWRLSAPCEGRCRHRPRPTPPTPSRRPRSSSPGHGMSSSRRSARSARLPFGSGHSCMSTRGGRRTRLRRTRGPPPPPRPRPQLRPRTNRTRPRITPPAAAREPMRSIRYGIIWICARSALCSTISHPRANVSRICPKCLIKKTSTSFVLPIPTPNPHEMHIYIYPHRTPQHPRPPRLPRSFPRPTPRRSSGSTCAGERPGGSTSAAWRSGSPTSCSPCSMTPCGATRPPGCIG